MSDIAAFAELLAERDSLSYHEEAKKIQAEYEKKLRVNFMRSSSREKYSVGAAIDVMGQAYPVFLKVYKDRVKQAYDAVESQKKALDETLEELAVGIELWNSDKDVSTYSTHCESSYMTQGWGARTYAQGYAGMDVDKCRHLGIDAAIAIRQESQYGTKFDCLVPLGKVETRVLKYQIGMLGMKDVLKFCMQRGLNPRVYWPMLPWGLEEKLGLDMFGNEVSSRSNI